MQFIPFFTNLLFKCASFGTPPSVQWLRLCTPNAGDMGLIPGTKTLHAALSSQKKKKEYKFLRYQKWAY